MGGKNREPLSLSARQVIEAMQDGVVVADPGGSIVAVNRAFCDVTGYSRRDVVGRSSRALLSGKEGPDVYAQMLTSVRRNGSWQGEVWNRRKNGAVRPEWLTISAIKDLRGRALGYLGVFRDISTFKLNEERLKKQAQYDPLTGLPNRRLLNERIHRALRQPDRRLAVLFLDLDHFKAVNDRWGHAAGDLLLRATGARLRSCVRRTDTVARWAGDEFAVLLNPVTGRSDAERVAKKILRVLRRPFSLNGRRTGASASIGVCLLEGKATPDQLLRKADRAMYSAKKRGRDSVQVWRRPLPTRIRNISVMGGGR